MSASSPNRQVPEFFFPSKLLGLLAAAKPVVTVAAPECELALSLAEGKFGVNIPPGHPGSCADLLEALAQDPQRLAEYSSAGLRYVEQFDKGRVFQDFAANCNRQVGMRHCGAALNRRFAAE
jgi:glycosyltransferase involved in cell wall biosynthesis